MKDAEVIYIEPDGWEDPGIGRTWCDHDAWDIGEPATRYIRADLVDNYIDTLRRVEAAIEITLGKDIGILHDIKHDIKQYKNLKK